MERKQVKRAVRDDDEGVTELSSLPDSILIHILSFLETKYAVRTSVLSLRWKNLWASVENIVFHLPTNMSARSMRIFMNFMDRVLLLHESPCIRTFFLDSGWQGCGIDVDRLNAWICAVLKRRVQEIYIRYNQLYNLPLSIFTSESLVVLSIYPSLDIDLPGSVYLPKLKSLRISLLSPNENVAQKLFRCCPVLEDLNIYASLEEERHTTIDICTPALKKLNMRLINELDSDGYETKVIVDAPILEYLSVTDECFAHYLLKNQSAVVISEIWVGEHWLDRDYIEPRHGNRVFQLLKAISNVRHLKLYGETLTALGCIHGGGLLRFSNVTHLELRIPSLSQFPDILDMMPNLQSLKANISEQPEDYEDDSIEIMQLHGIPSWEKMQSKAVPSCLLSKLREVELHYRGSEVEFLLAKYLLLNSKVLRKMRFNKSSCEAGNIAKKLQEIPKCSETCQIVLE